VAYPFWKLGFGVGKHTRNGTLYLDVAPFALLESENGKQTSGHMANQNSGPHARCLELTRPFKKQADTWWQQYL
jgi:hypothetical protein